jgi:hypothetical protein
VNDLVGILSHIHHRFSDRDHAVRFMGVGIGHMQYRATIMDAVLRPAPESDPAPPSDTHGKRKEPEGNEVQPPADPEGDDSDEEGSHFSGGKSDDDGEEPSDDGGLELFGEL